MQHAKRFKVGDRVLDSNMLAHIEGRVTRVEVDAPFVWVDFPLWRRSWHRRVNAMWLVHVDAPKPEPPRESYWEARRKERL